MERTEAIGSTEIGDESGASVQLISEKPAEVSWPDGSGVQVDMTPVDGLAWSEAADGVVLARPSDPLVTQDGLLPAAGERAPSDVDLAVLDQKAARAAGVAGVVLQVGEPSTDAEARSADPTTSGAGGVELALDYSGFAGAYGGDWASRLHLVTLPDCALTTPEKAACREQIPVASSNDVESSTVTATVAAASFGVLAVTAAASGSTGNWSATPLSPSAAWQVSAQTGDFTWSYPFRVPPVAAGPSPDLSVSYSAGSLDGRVASTNNQTSWIGDGWDMTAGYVERSYVPCSQDMAGGNNASRATGDLCWSTDNATLVLGGASGELVKDAATGAWHVKSDDGTKIEHLTGGWNTDNDGEFWKVTTLDGTQYFFGRGRRSATDTTALNSAWTVPVFGNQAGEPCYSASFASAYCTQAWRWNLEYVVDTSGNSLTYFYDTETNSYGRNLNQAVSNYVRGGYLTRVEYGQRVGSETASSAPDRVEFTVAERCLPSGSVTCDPAQLTAASAASWPDVPFDLICTSTTSCPAQTSPSFFTRKRLTTVTTKVLSGTAYQSVDSWTLAHTFPDPGDSTNAALWLSSISHSGLVGAAIALPKVEFSGVQMANRVDLTGDAGPPMNRFRVNAVHTESGATISVNYTPQDCTPGSLPPSPDSNTRRCFPVTWVPEGTGGPITEYFHKYLVDSVVADAGDSVSEATETHYSYVGDPAWHYDDNPVVPASYRTWSQFRGYDTVDVITGAPSAPQRSQVRYRYFRGMDGDHLASGEGRSVTVDGLADQERLNGFVREQVTYDGVGGAVVSSQVSTPWISAATATAANGTTASLLAVGASEQRTAASQLPGGLRVTRTLTTYDAVYGLPTQVDDQGDTSTATDDRCTRLEYARSTTAFIVSTVMRTETVAVGCGMTPARPGDVVSDQRILYDGGAYGAAPTRGLATTTQVASGFAGATPTYLTQSSSTYDALGRVLTVADALGRTTTTAYTPAASGPLTKTVVTSPDPDGTGPATALATTTVVNPAWGASTSETDANGKITTVMYDALGRRTAVWLPGRAQATQSASATYEYTVSSTAPDAITTKTLGALETYQTTVELFDGLERSRQTQSPSLARDTAGRVVTDTVYDSRGLVVLTNGSWFTSGDPSSTMVAPTEAVPSRARYVYDGAGRQVAQIADVADAEQWRTTTSYDGDRVSTDPPTGGVAQTTITDARGRTTELRQYTGGAPTGTYQATTYGYDKAGNLTNVKDAAGNAWTYTYDLLGRQTASSDPDKGTTSSTYDNGGQVVTTTDARSTTLAYTYDALGRKTTERSGSVTGTVLARWTYDTLAKGQLTSSTRYQGSDAYVTAVTGYDAGYRPLGQSVTIPASEGALAATYTTSYTYTVDGQVKTTKLPAAGSLISETVTTSYDAANMPQWVTGGGGWGMYVAGSTYSSYGQLLQMDLGNTTADYVNYDYEQGTQRLARTWLVRRGVTGNDLDISYTYDAAGNPTSAANSPTDEPVDAQCYGYDGLDRLASAWTPANGSCVGPVTVASLGGPAPYWSQYSFDAAGNRVGEVSHAVAGDTTSTYTYPVAGAARPHAVTSVASSGPAGSSESSYGYDAVGNTTSRAVAGEQSQSLSWDAQGRLASVTADGETASYVYAADGSRLVRRQGGTSTVYLPGGQEVTLSAASGTVSAVRYYSFAGQTVAVRTGMAGSSVSSLVNDPHGSAQLQIANGSGVLSEQRLDPFGVVRGSASSWTGDHGFLGKPVDGSGLSAVGARYYEASVGRFVSVDPVMDLSNPQQWAAYSYANNNPVTYCDPTGLLAPVGDWGKGPSRYTPARANTPAAPTTTVHPPVHHDSFSTRLKNSLQGAYVGAVNGGASVVNAMAQHPEDLVMWGLGAATMCWGAGMEVGGVALDATGVGAAVGIPINILGVGVISIGAGMAASGTLDLLAHANGDSRVEVMTRDSEASSGSGEGGRDLPGVGDSPTKVVNSNMGHIDLERAARAGFEDVRSAQVAVRKLGRSIETNGFPEGTIADSAHADRVLAPMGENGYAVYQIKPNGNAVFKTILTARG
ncbi:RHS repeat domain-containing protein [Cellulomonas soli]|uniref:RHS repeat domain-containing protein n=1 Tax=Cellulomonas soli TaxID=931535 RepID=UPI0015CE5503|nr:RHS repeat-associated core domain-containing protein [Cellulomonas soli]NYI59986.1 RHS repeat-associated protein [Cellulomonas soli]